MISSCVIKPPSDLATSACPHCTLLKQLPGTAIWKSVSAKQIVRTIRQANGILAQENGVEFRLIADKEWLIQDTNTHISLVLEIINRTDKILRFDVVNTIAFVLQDANGKRPDMRGGRDSIRIGRSPSPPLGKNQKFAVTYDAGLFTDGDKLAFYCKDEFTNSWYYSGLKEGKYLLMVGYDNTAHQSTCGFACWEGGGGASVEVTIKAKK